MKDYSIIPETCPLIDDIEDAIKDAYFTNTNHIQGDLLYKLELIRKANSDLRWWGNEQYLRAVEKEFYYKEALSEQSELERELKRINEFVDYLEDQIRDLKIKQSE